MKIDNILENAIKAKEDLENDYFHAVRNRLDEIIKQCQKVILEEEIKVKGGNVLLKRTKAAIKLLEFYSEKCPNCGAHIETDLNGKERQAFIIGDYCFFYLTSHLPGIPETPKENAVKVSELITDFYSKITNNHEKQINECMINIDIADIKLKIREHKAKNKGFAKYHRCMYDINNSKYTAENIIDCITILGGKNIIVYQDKKSDISNLIFESENGMSGLLPCRRY